MNKIILTFIFLLPLLLLSCSNNTQNRQYVEDQKISKEQKEKDPVYKTSENSSEKERKANITKESEDRLAKSKTESKTEIKTNASSQQKITLNELLDEGTKNYVMSDIYLLQIEMVENTDEKQQLKVNASQEACKALNKFKQAASQVENLYLYNQNNSDYLMSSIYIIGLIYLEGKCNDVKNYDLAMEWFKKVANSGKLPGAAEHKIGYMYENGYGVSQDYSKALIWYEQAKRKTDDEAILYDIEKEINNIKSKISNSNSQNNSIIVSENLTDKVKIIKTYCANNNAKVVLYSTEDVNISKSKFWIRQDPKLMSLSSDSEQWYLVAKIEDNTTMKKDSQMEFNIELPNYPYNRNDEIFLTSEDDKAYSSLRCNIRPEPTHSIVPTPPSKITIPQYMIITSKEAYLYIGEQKMVCGYVADTRYASMSKNKPTFLNFDYSFPNHTFTVVIWDLYRNGFNGAPDLLYKDKNICVLGGIYNYEGKPNMEVRSQGSITVK